MTTNTQKDVHSASLAIRVMQSKTTSHPPEWPIKRKTATVDKDVEKLELA